MNSIFTVIFLLSSVVLMFLDPQNFLPTLLSSSQKAATLCISLLSSYAVWMGFMQVMTDCKLTEKLSKALRLPASKLFKIERKETLTAVCMNLSANLLGLSGIATPYGIRAAEEMQREKHGAFAESMLFVVAATSIQLLPTTVLSLLVLYGSQNPYTIILPSLFSTIFSTVTGVGLTFLLVKK